MYLIRDIMYCKPGQVRPLVEKFKQLSKLVEKAGYGPSFRIFTDVSGERYWTMVIEQEVESFEKMAEMSRKGMNDPKFQKVMKGYHDLVESGRREIFSVEQ